MRKTMPYISRCSLLLVLTALALGCRPKEKDVKTVQKNPGLPNVLLIVSDDQGFGDFGFTGNPFIKTPNLDQLASESVVMENFYVSPLCSPTRANLMTGRYNYRTGVWDTWKGRDMMHPEELTLAEILRDAGYHTAHFGKWHLGTNIPCRPEDQGFDYSIRWDGIERFDPMMIENGEPVPYKGYLPHVIAGKAIEFIEQEHDRPFFAYVPFYTPHTHFRKQVPDSAVQKFDAYPEMPQLLKEVYAMVQELDSAVGSILTALEKTGQDERTLVIFLSDNGPQLGQSTGGNRYNCNLREGKGSVYLGGINVPAFFKHPEFEPITLTDHAAHIDILPTILDFCGIESPKDRKIDGISLLSVLEHQEPLPDRNIVIQQMRGERPVAFQNSTVVGPTYKLVNDNELYNIKLDSSESNNLAQEMPELLSSMKQSYLEWFNDVTNERPFEPTYTLIGSPEQPIITFYHTKRNEKRGYPLDVQETGFYRFTFMELQPELYPKKGKLGITLNGKKWPTKIPIAPDMESISVDSVYLKKGTGDMDILMINKLPKKFKYGNEDMGFRKLNVEQL